MKIKMQENHKRKTTKSRPLQSVLIIKLKGPCVCNHSLYSISVTLQAIQLHAQRLSAVITGNTTASHGLLSHVVLQSIVR